MSGALQGAAATNYTALVKPLQWLVVVVIFLFFLRVARAITVQAKAPRDVSPGTARRRNRRFALEFIEPDTRFGERVELPSHLDIGRAAGSDLVLDDAYVSSRHASVEYGAEGLLLSDLGSTNGTYVNEKVIDAPTRLKRGDVVQIGSFVLEVVR